MSRQILSTRGDDAQTRRWLLDKFMTDSYHRPSSAYAIDVKGDAAAVRDSEGRRDGRIGFCRRQHVRIERGRAGGGECAEATGA